jgi:hypothetical protein
MSRPLDPVAGSARRAPAERRTLVHGNPPRNAITVPALDAPAPIAGAPSTRFPDLPPAGLALYLGTLGGLRHSTAA